MLKLKDIAELTGGVVKGDLETEIKGIAKIEDANAGDLAFIGNPKYEHYIYETKATAVFVSIGFEPKSPVNCILIKSAYPYLNFCQVLDRFFNPISHPVGVEEPSFIAADVVNDKENYIGAFSYLSQGVKLGKNVKIYPNCFVGANCSIGDNTILYPGTKLMAACHVGKNCIIHSGTVIGSDGFGHAPMPDGSYAKIPQVGNVVIEDEVEIGSNCTIDRATMGATIIRKGVKLDNLIQVAHNAEIGANTVIAAQTGISGSTKLGERCIIGGQVGFVGHISVANGTQIGAQSGVQKAVKEENQQFIGSPMMPLREAFKTQVLMRNLPKISERINALEKKLK